MNFCVHIHVCFSCNDNEPVAKVAAAHLAALGEDVREARWFLNDLSKRTGINTGTKGGLSLWGMTGNYTSAERFIKALMPFWKGVYEIEEGDLLDFEHVLVFEEAEGAEQTTAYELSYDDDTRIVSVQKHLCPFAFMQM